MNQPLKDALLELEAELQRRIEAGQKDLLRARHSVEDLNFRLGEAEANKSALKFTRYLRTKFGA